MNETELLRKLGKASAGANVPEVDVAAGAMRRIAHSQPDFVRPLAIFTALSSVAAAVAAAFATSAWMDWQDPLSNLFSSLDWVMK